jgi:hypothetical protein
MDPGFRGRLVTAGSYTRGVDDQAPYILPCLMLLIGAAVQFSTPGMPHLSIWSVLMVGGLVALAGVIAVDSAQRRS